MCSSDFKKLFNDTMFKIILSNKRYMNWFLCRFLNENISDYSIINKFDGKVIDNFQVMELLKQELVNSNVHVRKKTVDLLVKKDNLVIDIEINSTFDKNVRKRNFAYLSSVYSNLLKHGHDFDEQPRCIQINVCDGICHDYDNYCLLGEKYYDKFIDNVNFLVFDVAKYKNILYTGNKKLIKKYAHIIIFDCDESELELLGKYDKMVKEIGDMIKQYNDDNIFNFMLDEESEEKLRRAQLKTAKQEAREQGLKQGIEQGIEKYKMDIAFKMLESNYPISQISELTGYSSDYIKSIQV